MPYREVTRTGKLGGRLAAHARQHARRVAESATAPFRDRLPPDREFLDLYEFQIAISDELDRRRDELLAIDDRHARQLERDRQLREQRDSWMVQVRAALIKIKDTAEGGYGPGASRKIFNEDPPVLPDDPAALHQVGQRVFDSLTDPEFALEPTQDGVAVNPRTLAEGFRIPLEGLGDSLEQLHVSESETRHTQSLKDAALEEYNTYTGNAARYLEAYFVLAGHKRLAKRLRQSSHGRAARDEPSSGPAPAAEPAPEGEGTADVETDVEAAVASEEAAS